MPNTRLAGVSTPVPTIDRSIALELSSQLADENRLAFARDFSAAAALSYNQNAKAGGLTFSERMRLSAKAQSAAAAIGTDLRVLSPVDAAYLVGNLYTALLPKRFRAQHGIFYTPPALVDCLLAMVEDAGIDWRKARVLDPACGGGAFLIGAALRMARAMNEVEPSIALQNIGARLCGFDADPFGAWLAQKMTAVALQPMAHAAGRNVPQLVESRDSLDLRQQEAASWDLIIGNPPYGRVTLSAERRKRFARSIYGHANLYGLFTEAALYWARPGGVVGFVTPTSMLSGLYYKALRQLIGTDAPPLAVCFVNERDGVFDGVLQETMLAAYRKGGLPTAASVGFIDIELQSGGTRVGRTGFFTLPKTAHSPWLLPRSQALSGLARRLRSMPHRLGDYGYGVSTGPLVWNRHKGQFRACPSADAFPVIWAESVTSDGRFLWRSEKRNHMPWLSAKLPHDDWLIVKKPCVLLQRTTAKEQARRLIAAELPAWFICRHQGVVIENHLNMIRAVIGRPRVSPTVIATLLNSAAVDAAFRCLNGSVAVSAFELEELPVPGPAVMAKLARLVAAGAPASIIEATISTAYGKIDAPAA